MSDDRQYYWSTDYGETWHGPYESADAAYGSPECVESAAGEEVSIGIPSPVVPSVHISGEDVIDRIAYADEFDNDDGDAWKSRAMEHADDLTRAIREVVEAWIERHDLTPQWVTIDEIEVRNRENPRAE